MIEAITRSEIRSEGRLQVVGLSARYKERLALENVSLAFPAQSVTAIIGPSGCGKSTLLRCLNRLHEEIPEASVEGIVSLDGANIYADDFEPIVARRMIGMVLQHPCPFPTMSILDNAVVGLRHSGVKSRRSERREIAERALRHVGLWDEVKDVLDRSGTSLSGGQQQRLCIARALALQPRILLLDEPCSALDAFSASTVQDLIASLARELTVVVVTHDLEQAARISTHSAFLFAEEDGVGHVIERGPTGEILTAPRHHRTQEYLSGRFG